MSPLARDGTSVFRHTRRACVLCGAVLPRTATGRRRLYCGGPCRQRAYRLREEARLLRAAEGAEARPGEVARLLAAVLRAPTRR